jgi:hypothetical protein
MAENPYEPPQSQERPPGRRRSLTKTIVAILILIGMFPAAGTAGFAICLAVAENGPRSNSDPYGVGNLMFGAVVGVLGGAVVIGLMLWWGIALARTRVERPREWLRSDGTKFEAFYVSSDQDTVILRNSEGTESQIPLYQLCDRDREWIAMQK